MIGFFARHPTAANLLMLALVVLGLIAYPQLRRETFPEFSAQMVRVTVAYPGASADAVEANVVQRIEDAVTGIKGVTEVSSVAQEGVGTVTLEIDDDADMATVMADIKSEVEGIKDLPEDSEKPIIQNPGLTSTVAALAVTGPMSTTDLKAYCEELKRKLKQRPGISLVELSGFSDHQIQVRLRAGVVGQYGLSVRELADVVASQSIDMPVGTIEGRDGDYLIRFSEERRTPAELADLVVLAGAAGGEVRLGDLAEIRDAFEDETQKTLFNGKRAGLLTITKTESQDALDVFEAVQDFMDEIAAAKPPGVEITVTNNQASVVEDRLGLLLTNAYQGLILVFVALWLFLDLRLSFWVAAGLPVSFLGALFVMNTIGYSLNMMTMMALLMALGLLMDDAIVLAENVASHRRLGKSPMQAAVDGVQEVSWGVLSSFATTAAIFVPLAFLEGTIGKVLLVIPVVLITVLSVSLIEAFLILPNHLGHMKPTTPSWFRQWFDATFEHVRENYLGRAVDWCVQRRYLVVGATIGVFVASVGLLAGGVVKFQAFPEVDGDTVELRLMLPPGSPFERTESMVDEAVAALDRVNEELSKNQPEGRQLVQSYSIKYGQNSDAGTSGAHLATVVVDLLPAEERNGTLDEFLTRWREEVGPTSDVVANFTDGGIGVAGSPIEVRVQGDDLEELQAVSQDVQAWFEQFNGAYNLRDDLRAGTPEMRIKMRPGAMSANVNASTIARQLSSALSGQVARQVQVGTEDYEIHVRLAESDTDTLDDLEYFQVSIGNQQRVPLGTIATISSGRGYAGVSRVDGLRTVTVEGDVDPDVLNVSELTSLFKSEMVPKLEETHPAVGIRVAGESDSSNETTSSMLSGFVIGLFAIFVLLSFQFRSFVEPLVVLLAIPFALIGVIWGNLLMGDSLSLPGLLGFCALGGVVVNDSILLIETIKLRRRERRSIVESATLASRGRFRAILLTSLTTVAGLMPLMFETSLQAQTLIPVATSIVFGTLTSTVLVLLVLPAMYSVLGDIGWAESIEPHEEDGSPESVPPPSGLLA